MSQLKKVFILTQFGEPHSWTDKYFKNVQNLEQYGYFWKIFTPNKYDFVPPNVEIIPMTIEELNELMEKKIGVNPKNFILPSGVPSKHVSDFYVASGAIFEDYIKGFDFWGITNWDIVYGRLPLFFPDDAINQSDIFSDDVNTLNGIFSLFRNVHHVNNLFKEIPDWQMKFTTHKLFGTDEYDMTEVIRKNNSWLRFIYPGFFPMHSHDRLEQHVPNVKLSLTPDGSLWELFLDTAAPQWEHARPLMGREIPYFHFIRTKKWPVML